MKRILFSTTHVPWPWLRQTENGAGTTGNSLFLLNKESSEDDFLAVYDEPHAPFHTSVPRERRILFIGEPPAVKIYPKRYLQQFGCVVSPFPLKHFAGRQEIQHPCLPWHYGVDYHQRDICKGALNVQQLSQTPPHPKSEELSLITSTKTITPEHRRRLVFVNELTKALGDRVAVFGRGFREIGDKAEAILPYKYHIVLENNQIDNFWTEKTADAFLGYSMPLFSGCSNFDKYFSAGCFRNLDLSNISGAIASVSEILKTDPYQRCLPAIVEARKMILGHYNLFNYLDALTDSISKTVTRQLPTTLLLPSSRWQRFAEKLLYRMKNRVSTYCNHP